MGVSKSDVTGAQTDAIGPPVDLPGDDLERLAEGLLRLSAEDRERLAAMLGGDGGGGASAGVAENCEGGGDGR